MLGGFPVPQVVRDVHVFVAVNHGLVLKLLTDLSHLLEGPWQQSEAQGPALPVPDA